MTGPGGKAGLDLAGTLIKVVAIGVAGGAALIGGAMAVGEKLLDKQKADHEKLEAQREAYNEEVRRIVKAESGTDL